MEVEVGDLELELGLAGGHRHALLVLGLEPEARLPDELRGRGVGARGGVDPATAGDESGVRIVGDDHRHQAADRVRARRAALGVGHGEAHQIHARRGERIRLVHRPARP